MHLCAILVDDRNISEPSGLLKIADELGLDIEVLQQYLETQTYKAAVDRQRTEGLERQISGVPAMFVEPVEEGAFPVTGVTGVDFDRVERLLLKHV